MYKTNQQLLVRIDTKNWFGSYNSRLVRFNDQDHMDNYMRVCHRDESQSKVIGISVLEQD